MINIRLDGVNVVESELTQRTFRTIPCQFLIPVTAKTQKTALAEFASKNPQTYSGLRVSGIADLSFLSDFPDLLYLELVDQAKVKTAPLQALSNLRGLRIKTPGTGIDFSWFPLLEVFVGDWHPDNINMHHCRELRTLLAWNFKPDSQNLTPLANIVRLERLMLVKTNLESLRGIEMLEDLRSCDISYAPQLRSLAALGEGEPQLRDLCLFNAKKIVDYRPIARCRWLRTLKLTSCVPLADLKWLEPLQRLESFSFVETPVADNDLRPLLKLPALRYAGSMDKKNYTPRIDDLNRQLEARFAT
jgi:hypothetical protein